MDSTELKKRIEAVLFMSTEPVSAEKISAIAGIGPVSTVKQALEELVNEYAARESAIIITNTNNAYVMQVRDNYLDIASKVSKNTELSKGEIRTLAYIAKKEGNSGVMQSQLVKSLGASVYGHICTLVEKRFINAKKKGRSKLLNTTAKFREYFKMPE